MEDILNKATTHLPQAVAGKHILLIEDSSELSFGLNPAKKDLGKVGSGVEQGFFVHPVIALDADHKISYGLGGYKIFKRPELPAGLQEADLKTRKAYWDSQPLESKGSYRWLSSIKDAHARCSQAANTTVVADREADIYEALCGFVELGVNFLVRMRADRPAISATKDANAVTNISTALAGWQPGGTYSVDLPATDKRSAHKAELDVKWGRVQIKRPKTTALNKLPPVLDVNIIEVKESAGSVVGSEQPVHWVLLTTHQIETFEHAQRCIRWYCWRWYIEQVFRLLKSKGLDITSSGLTTYESLSKMAAMSLVAAVRVLQLLLSRDNTYAQPLSDVFSSRQIECLGRLNPTLEGRTEKLKNPYPPQSLAFGMWVIARLAGWSGYLKQTPPGPITLHRGLIRFQHLFEGFELAGAVAQNSS